jgi:hypothetical protein
LKVYKYLSGDEGSFRIISEGTIKFSDPRTFNDPFDCAPCIEIPSEEDILKYRPELIERVIESLKAKGGDKFNARKKAIARLINSIKNGDFLDQILDKARVLSLSKTPYEILMWSHYANNHKGFALEFEIPLEQVARKIVNLQEDRLFAAKCWNLSFEEVVYSENRPTMSAYKQESDPVYYLQNLLLTKSKAWSYEQEVRVIDNRGGTGINNYNPKFLKSVICGSKASNDFVKTLTRLTENFNEKHNTKVKILHAIACEKTYKIEIPGI